MTDCRTLRLYHHWLLHHPPYRPSPPAPSPTDAPPGLANTTSPVMAPRYQAPTTTTAALSADPSSFLSFITLGTAPPAASPTVPAADTSPTPPGAASSGSAASLLAGPPSTDGAHNAKVPDSGGDFACALMAGAGAGTDVCAGEAAQAPSSSLPALDPLRVLLAGAGTFAVPPDAVPLAAPSPRTPSPSASSCGATMSACCCAEAEGCGEVAAASAAHHAAARRPANRPAAVMTPPLRATQAPRSLPLPRPARRSPSPRTRLRGGGGSGGSALGRLSPGASHVAPQPRQGTRNPLASSVGTPSARRQQQGRHPQATPPPHALSFVHKLSPKGTSPTSTLTPVAESASAPVLAGVQRPAAAVPAGVSAVGSNKCSCLLGASSDGEGGANGIDLAEEAALPGAFVKLGEIAAAEIAAAGTAGAPSTSAPTPEPSFYGPLGQANITSTTGAAVAITATTIASATPATRPPASTPTLAPLPPLFCTAVAACPCLPGFDHSTGFPLALPGTPAPTSCEPPPPTPAAGMASPTPALPCTVPVHVATGDVRGMMCLWSLRWVDNPSSDPSELTPAPHCGSRGGCSGVAGSIAGIDNDPTRTSAQCTDSARSHGAGAGASAADGKGDRSNLDGAMPDVSLSGAVAAPRPDEQKSSARASAGAEIAAVTQPADVPSEAARAIVTEVTAAEKEAERTSGGGGRRPRKVCWRLAVCVRAHREGCAVAVLAWHPTAGRWSGVAMGREREGKRGVYGSRHVFFFRASIRGKTRDSSWHARLWYVSRGVTRSCTQDRVGRSRRVRARLGPHHSLCVVSLSCAARREGGGVDR